MELMKKIIVCGMIAALISGIKLEAGAGGALPDYEQAVQNADHVAENAARRAEQVRKAAECNAFVQAVKGAGTAAIGIAGVCTVNSIDGLSLTAKATSIVTAIGLGSVGMYLLPDIYYSLRNNRYKIIKTATILAGAALLTAGCYQYGHFGVSAVQYLASFWPAAEGISGAAASISPVIPVGSTLVAEATPVMAPVFQQTMTALPVILAANPVVSPVAEMAMGQTATLDDIVGALRCAETATTERVSWLGSKMAEYYASWKNGRTNS